MLIFCMIVLAGLWGLAGIAWVMHRFQCERTADTMMLIVLLGMSALVLWEKSQPAPISRVTPVLRLPSANLQAAEPPLTVNGLLSTADSQPSTVDALTVYGSTIKDVYHAAGCRYIGDIQHACTWASSEEAMQQGKRPCQHCHPESRVAASRQ